MEPETWLDAIIKNMGDAVVGTDNQGHILFMNPAAEALSGCKSLEYKGSPLPEVFQFINENNRKWIADPVQKVLKTGRTVNLADHALLVTNAGREIQISCHVSPVFDENGCVAGTLLVFTDISKSRQTEAEINRHMLEMNILLKISQSVSSFLDLDNVLQVISDGTAELLNIETAAVYLLEDEDLYLGATTPALDPDVPESFRRAAINDHPFIRKTVSTCKPVILHDTKQAKLSPAEINIVKIRKLRSLIFLPFQQEDKVIGVLILGTTGHVRDFSNHEIELCHTISNQLSLGVQNARLHAGLMKYNKQLEEQISERKRAEEQIQKDLKEKEVMLKEIHHRVKNNLSVIISLLKLQANRIQTREQALSAFTESCDRIYSMALIHEQLYKSEDFLKIDMKNYIKTISHNLKQAYAYEKNIILDMNIDNVFLDINHAIPCGLILNELITNAYKHAFQDTRKGSIGIGFQILKTGDYQLSVSDTGSGLPQGINIEKSETLGLRLIHILASQIDGKLKIISDPKGTKFTIWFSAA